ncbi:hypothetical protein Sjap_002876 [Stephania japonica]|uniref:Uncharacterized protein n=1 Tax=Stephania japonica TaxID=461633 RepID=A0AAP0PWJ0_9MAGN
MRALTRVRVFWDRNSKFMDVEKFSFAVSRKRDWASLMCAICIAVAPEVPGTASRELREFLGCCLKKESMRQWTAAQLMNHPYVMQSNYGQNHSGGLVNGGGS